MMLLPMLNGGSVANEWQPMSALMCNGPISRCSSFIAEKNGRSGQPVQSPDGRAGTSRARRALGTSGTSFTAAPFAVTADPVAREAIGRAPFAIVGAEAGEAPACALAAAVGRAPSEGLRAL